MKLTFEFDRREAFELDALNAMLHNAGLEELRLENCESYLAVSRDRWGSVLGRRCGFDRLELSGRVAENAASGRSFRIDTQVLDNSQFDEEHCFHWQEQHPDRELVGFRAYESRGNAVSCIYLHCEKAETEL